MSKEKQISTDSFSMKKLTSEQLGELCDVNAGYIRQIESGRRLSSFTLFINFCNALNISSDYLLEQELNFAKVVDDDIYSIAYEKVRKLPPDQIEMLNCIIDAIIKKNGD